MGSENLFRKSITMTTMLEMNTVKKSFEGIKVLLVDLDGTLVGAKDVPLAIDFVVRAIKTVRDYGGTRKAIRALNAVQSALLSKPKNDNSKTNATKAVESFAEVLNMGVDQAQNVLVEGTRKIFPKLQKHFYPIEGAKNFIEWAKDHYPLVLATNPVWPLDIVELRIKWAGIDPKIFKRITLAKEMSAAKPWHRYYEEILQQEGLNPEECLLIGNDLKKDLPATEVGIRTFIIDPHRKALKRLSESDGLAAYQGRFEHLRQILEA